MFKNEGNIFSQYSLTTMRGNVLCLSIQYILDFSLSGNKRPGSVTVSHIYHTAKILCSGHVS